LGWEGGADILCRGCIRGVNLIISDNFQNCCGCIRNHNRQSSFANGYDRVTASLWIRYPRILLGEELQLTSVRLQIILWLRNANIRGGRHHDADLSVVVMETLEVGGGTEEFVNRSGRSPMMHASLISILVPNVNWKLAAGGVQ
jgi:hypothetical protein